MTTDVTPGDAIRVSKVNEFQIGTTTPATSLAGQLWSDTNQSNGFTILKRGTAGNVFDNINSAYSLRYSRLLWESAGSVTTTSTADNTVLQGGALWLPGGGYPTNPAGLLIPSSWNRIIVTGAFTVSGGGNYTVGLQAVNGSGTQNYFSTASNPIISAETISDFIWVDICNGSLHAKSLNQEVGVVTGAVAQGSGSDFALTRWNIVAKVSIGTTTLTCTRMQVWGIDI